MCQRCSITCLVSFAIRFAACPSFLTRTPANEPGCRSDAGRAAHSRWAIWLRRSAEGRRFLSNARFGVLGTLIVAMAFLAENEIGSVGAHHVEREQVLERLRRLLSWRALVVLAQEDLRHRRRNRRVLEDATARDD